MKIFYLGEEKVLNSGPSFVITCILKYYFLIYQLQERKQTCGRVKLPKLYLALN